MGGEKSLSVYEKLLLAAFSLEEKGQKAFTAENLVVEAWQEFPDTFGLAGYRDPVTGPSYPDSNRVFAEIMGSKPIRKRGFLVKTGEKIYQLTETGRQEARFLVGQKQGSTTTKIDLPRDLQHRLRALMNCRASEKFRNGRLDDISLHDACTFWRISPRSSAIEMEGNLANIETLLRSSLDAIRSKTVTFVHSGDAFMSDDVERLMKLDEALRAKFRDQLDIIAKRRDQR